MYVYNYFMQIGRENSDERQALLVRITDLQLEQEELLKEIQKYKDNDPEFLEQLQKESTVCNHVWQLYQNIQ